MRKYHELGTAKNVLPLNELGALPTMNLKAARFERAEEISGERLAERRSHLGYALGARHSHLDSAGYSYDQKTVGKVLSAENVVNYLLEEERWRQVLTSLVICLFARGVYTPQVVVEAFKPLGWELSEGDLKEIGRKIHLLKLKYKLGEGFSFEGLRFPKRIFETLTPHGQLDPAFMKQTLKLYRARVEEELRSLEAARRG